jgi:hypothetical protein
MQISAGFNLSIMFCLILACSACTTYSAKEYDPSVYRHQPSRYQAPQQPYYPEDFDQYYRYGTNQAYPYYQQDADNPGYYHAPQTPSAGTVPSHQFPLYLD